MRKTPFNLTEVRQKISLGREADVERLHQPGPARYVEMASFVLVWAAGGFLCLAAPRFLPAWMRLPVTLAGILLSAIALNVHPLLVHEGMHSVLFRNRFLNQIVSTFYAFTFHTSFTAYQVQHLRHHRHLGTDKDPDDYRNYSNNPRVVWILSYVRILTGAYLSIPVMPILSFRCGSPSERRRILSECALMVAIYAVLLHFVPFHFLLFAWFLPLFLVNFMVNLRGLAQHTLADPEDVFLASRTFQVGRVAEFCLIGENYHLIHHLFPTAPSYHLRELHHLLEDRLPRQSNWNSYLGFFWTFVKASGKGDESRLGIRSSVKGAA